MNASTFTVKTKLTLALGSLAVLVLLVSALALRALGHEHAGFSSFVANDIARLQLAHRIVDAANARAVGARNLVLATDLTQVDEIKSAITSAHERLQQDVSALKQAVAHAENATATERDLVASFEEVEAKYGALALGIVDMALQGQRDEAITKMNRDCRPLLAALVGAGTAYIDYASKNGVAAVEDANATYALNRKLLLGACMLAIAAALVLTWAITRSIAGALGAEPAELGAAAERVAGGDLRPVLGAQAAPQGSVLASLGRMQESLARVVGEVRAASDSIATGSGQIASGNADLSKRTEDQAANLQQTAASMEEMNAAVKSSADTARQATQLAASASAAAARGGQAVGEVIATMEDISVSSKRIADILSVIDGIAFQTNILALNAAVEAARAGEQGRGFAVVASEVRSLAQRSAGAAKEIKTLIGTSVEKVEEGARRVQEAGGTMSDIVVQVKRVSDLIGELDSASAEQTAGIGQVSQSVTQLDRVTQQNAALVEESAAAAGSLSQQATRLAELMSVFTVEGSAPNPAPRAPEVAALRSRDALRTRARPSIGLTASAGEAAQWASF